MADKIIDININPNSPKLALKQDKEDNELMTDKKTVVGSINDNFIHIKRNEKAITEKQNIINDGKWISIIDSTKTGRTTVDITIIQMTLIAHELLERRSWSNLKTMTKNVLGAVNEIQNPWENVGAFGGKQQWNFVPISGRYYRVSYNLSPNAVVYMQKIFRWSGSSTDAPVELDQHILFDTQRKLTVISLIVTSDSLKIDTSVKPLQKGLGEIFKVEKCVWDDF